MGHQCFSNGGLALLIFGCILGTSLLAVTLALAFCWLFQRRKEEEKIFVIEKGALNAQYENEQFQHDEADGSLASGSPKKAGGAAKVNQQDQITPAESTTASVKKQNSYLEKLILRKSPVCQQHSLSTESLVEMQRVTRVSLQSQDAGGLGFTIEGNMRDGTFIKDVLPRGAANHSNMVHSGDRIVRVSIDFSKMVFEDALTILSYASPYAVTLQLQTQHEELLPLRTVYGPERKAKLHPLFRSQSAHDLTAAAAADADTRPQEDYAKAQRSKSVTAEAASVSKEVSARLEKIEESPLLSHRRVVYRNAHAQPVEHTSVAVAAETKDQPVQVSATDPYGDLSPQDKMEVLRLSYENPSVSQSTPNLLSDSQTLSQCQQAEQQQPRSKGPPTRRLKLQRTEALFGDAEIPVEKSSQIRPGRPASPPPPVPEKPPEFEKLTAKIATVSREETPFRLPKQFSEPGLLDQLHLIKTNADDELYNVPTSRMRHGWQTQKPLSLDAPLGVALPQMDVDGKEGAVEGLEMAKVHQKMDKEQYQKLMYFQQQLTIQQAELAKLGILVPDENKKASKRKGNYHF